MWAFLEDHARKCSFRRKKITSRALTDIPNSNSRFRTTKFFCLSPLTVYLFSSRLNIQLSNTDKIIHLHLCHSTHTQQSQNHNITATKMIIKNSLDLFAVFLSIDHISCKWTNYFVLKSLEIIPLPFCGLVPSPFVLFCFQLLGITFSLILFHN